MKIAFQGVHGAYSEVAAKKFFGDGCTTVPFDRFEHVFDAVEKRRADRAIIPIENSLAGSIHQNYDLMLTHSLHIVGEFHLRIEHTLMCHPTSSWSKIASVRSHPLAFSQCSRFLARYSRLQPEPFFDTAGAAQSIAANHDRTTAAIASEYAARLYGLKILKRNIENSARNFTRFLLLSRSRWKPQKGVRTKTSIVFMPATNQTGILFRSLGVFYVRNIDLLKIESRPNPASPFEYMFYLDLEGSPKEKRVTEALDHLREFTKMYRLLGVYPMGKGKFYGASR